MAVGTKGKPSPGRSCPAGTDGRTPVPSLRSPRHLMGKKSTGDFPYVYEEENKTPFSALPENIKQLQDYLKWEEISKYLLRLLEGNENQSAHFSKGGLPWYARSPWETDDNSSWKEMMDYLLQVVNMKESAPS
nr:gastrin-releasing peptide [Columba livia]